MQCCSKVNVDDTPEQPNKPSGNQIPVLRYIHNNLSRLHWLDFPCLFEPSSWLISRWSSWSCPPGCKTTRWGSTRSALTSTESLSQACIVYLWVPGGLKIILWSSRTMMRNNVEGRKNDYWGVTHLWTSWNKLGWTRHEGKPGKYQLLYGSRNSSHNKIWPPVIVVVQLVGIVCLVAQTIRWWNTPPRQIHIPDEVGVMTDGDAEEVYKEEYWGVGELPLPTRYISLKWWWWRWFIKKNICK